MEKENDIYIVSSIKLAYNPFENVYTAIGPKSVQVKNAVPLQLNDSIKIDGASIIKKEDGKKYTTAINKLVKKANIKANAKGIKTDKRYSSVVEKMMPKLSEAASKIVKGFLSGVPIVVRFHNDGDGSSGAIALYRAFCDLEKKFCDKQRQVSWQMNKGIAYTGESLHLDRMLFESYKSMEKPIVIITDFGTSPESEDAIKSASKVCDLVWLDHHAEYEGFPKELIGHYINPLEFGGDSNFTAGMLTCILSEMISGINTDDLRGASLVSDYSTFADFKDREAVKNALILDYLTSIGEDMSAKPKHMDSIIKDKEKSDNTFRHASTALEEAIVVGIRNVKNYKNNEGINIYVLDFEHVAKLKLDYPLPGRYSSKLQDHIESINGGNTMIMVHQGSYISIRMSKDIVDSIDILGKIEKLKKNSEGAISGGGHRQAASIRTNKENINELVRKLLVELGVRKEN